MLEAWREETIGRITYIKSGTYTVYWRKEENGAQKGGRLQQGKKKQKPEKEGERNVGRAERGSDGEDTGKIV